MNYTKPQLPPLEQRAPMASGCTRLMAVVQLIFNRGGCHHARRLDYG